MNYYVKIMEFYGYPINSFSLCNGDLSRNSKFYLSKSFAGTTFDKCMILNAF